MNGQSRPYAIHSDGECDRLERQATLAGLEEHLARLSGLPRLTSILDVGCGSGSMARLMAAIHPRCAGGGCRPALRLRSVCS
jgi:hypothetical protein